MKTKVLMNIDLAIFNADIEKLCKKGYYPVAPAVAQPATAHSKCFYTITMFKY